MTKLTGIDLCRDLPHNTWMGKTRLGWVEISLDKVDGVKFSKIIGIVR